MLREIVLVTTVVVLTIEQVKRLKASRKHVTTGVVVLENVLVVLSVLDETSVVRGTPVEYGVVTAVERLLLERLLLESSVEDVSLSQRSLLEKGVGSEEYVVPCLSRRRFFGT